LSTTVKHVNCTIVILLMTGTFYVSEPNLRDKIIENKTTVTFGGNVCVQMMRNINILILFPFHIIFAHWNTVICNCIPGIIS